MTTFAQRRAETSASDPNWMLTQVRRAALLTSQASLSLGLSKADADEVARGGGISLDGVVGTVSVLPILESAQKDTAPLLVTLNTGRPLASLAPDELIALLALAPTLGVFQASIGCDPGGALCLFRLIRPEDVSKDGIAAALRHAWHLAKLVWGDAPAQQGAQ
jgi:hypothetical protein